MYTRTNCPQCSAAVRIPDEYAGKTIRCKHCKGTFKAPEVVPTLEEATPEEITAAKPPPSLARQRPPLRHPDDELETPPVRRSLAPWILVGSLALLLAVCLGGGAAFMIFARGTATVAGPVQPPPAVNGGPAAAEAAADGPVADEPVAVVPLKPAPLREDRVAVQFPGAVGDVCVGGAGRFLILHLPQQRQLAIFDSDEAKVVKYLSVAEDKPLLAASFDKLFVALPDSNVLQRFSLATFEKELTVPSPVQVTDLATGSAAHGPLLVLSLNGQGQQPNALTCLDPQTLRPGSVRVDLQAAIFPPNFMRGQGGHVLHVSADGQVITGIGFFARSGNTYVRVGRQDPLAFMEGAPLDSLPGPDGRYLYATGQHFSLRGRPVGQNNSGHGRMQWLLPALQPPYYLSLDQVDAGLSAAIHLAGEPRQLVRVSGGAELTKDLSGLVNWQTGQHVPFESHVFFSPQAKLLAVLPGSKDKLVLYRADVDQLLAAAGVDFLFVTSQPPAEFRPGTLFSYPVAVRSRKGGVKFKLETGPAGMSVSDQGQVSWAVPAGFAEPEASVTLTVSDASGQEVLHTFQVTAHGRQVAANRPAAGPIDGGPPPGLAPRVPGREMAKEVPRPPDPQPQFQPPVPQQQPRDTALAGTPLVRPPARTLPLVAAPLPEAKTTLSLPGAARDVCVGGGGRFLIFHLPQQRQLAVFDCNEAKVVKYLSVAEDDVLFAAGMTKLMVVLPSKGLVQRWDLTSFQREVTVPLPISGKVFTAAMGSAADGALILGGPAVNNNHGGLPLVFLDIQTLKEVKPSGQEGMGGMVGTHPQYPHTMRVSADGRTVTMWNVGLSPMGLQSVLLNGSALRVFSEHDTVGAILPTPDGQTLCTARGMFTSELKKIGDRATPTPPRLPAVQGDYSVSLGQLDPARAAASKSPQVAVYRGRDTRPLVTLTDVDGLDGSRDQFGRSNGLPPDKRFFLIPAAKLIVTVPAAADKLYLQRFDLDEILEKSGIDYLYVSSQPVSAAVKGKAYAYPLTVKSKKGGVTFKLESGPPGMKVAKDGRLTWDVPADFADREVTVLLTIGDASGQEVFHTFPVAIKDKGDPTAAIPPPAPAVERKDPATSPDRKPAVADVAPPKPPRTDPAAAKEKPATASAAPAIHPAPLKEDREQRPLPGTVGEVCVGGGGRFLIFTIPQQRQIAVFDANEAKVVKFLSVGEGEAKVAACVDKLIVLLPGSNVLQRYNLTTLEREVATQCPAGRVGKILLGSASRGPLILLGADRAGQNALPALDPYTFKEMTGFSVDGFLGSPQDPWRISGDGSVITSYSPGTSPQGHTVRTRIGNEYKSHGLEGDVAGVMAPGPEGRFVYTARGVFTSAGKPSGKLGSYSDGSRFSLPAAEGEAFYLRIDVHGFPHGMEMPARRGRQAPGAEKIYLHLAGDDRPLGELAGVEIPKRLNTWGREKFLVDQRYFLIPSAKLLVFLPETRDRLLLYRVDVDELLAKAPYDYLVVLSRPPDTAVAGQLLTYTPTVKSRKGGVKMKLESGPPGMAVSPEGKLSWQVPADFAPGECDVILSVGDASGQEVFQNFRLTVRGK